MLKHPAIGPLGEAEEARSRRHPHAGFLFSSGRGVLRRGDVPGDLAFLIFLAPLDLDDERFPHERRRIRSSGVIRDLAVDESQLVGGLVAREPHDLIRRAVDGQTVLERDGAAHGSSPFNRS